MKKVPGWAVTINDSLVIKPTFVSPLLYLSIQKSVKRKWRFQSYIEQFLFPKVALNFVFNCTEWRNAVLKMILPLELRWFSWSWLLLLCLPECRECCSILCQLSPFPMQKCSQLNCNSWTNSTLGHSWGRTETNFKLQFMQLGNWISWESYSFLSWYLFSYLSIMEIQSFSERAMLLALNSQLLNFTSCQTCTSKQTCWS